jgi:hypothetical protein
MMKYKESEYYKELKRGWNDIIKMNVHKERKRIANRVDKWNYVGGHVGHLWKDLNGKKHNSISDIMHNHFVSNKQSKFMIDWKEGELFAYEKEI